MIKPKISAKKLSRVDLEILFELQNDGRQNFVQIAEKIGIPYVAFKQKIRTLEKYGAIRRYYADINPKILGPKIVMFIEVWLKDKGKDELSKFESLVSEWSMVRECYQLNGDSDFFLKVFVKNIDEYRKFLLNQLITIKNVDNVKMHLVARSSKLLPDITIEKTQEVIVKDIYNVLGELSYFTCHK